MRVPVRAPRLPCVAVLNSCSVSEADREAAERFFIRHHQDRPQQELPHRYVVSMATSPPTAGVTKYLSGFIPLNLSSMWGGGGWRGVVSDLWDTMAPLCAAQ